MPARAAESSGECKRVLDKVMSSCALVRQEVGSMAALPEEALPVSTRQPKVEVVVLNFASRRFFCKAANELLSPTSKLSVHLSERSRSAVAED